MKNLNQPRRSSFQLPTTEDFTCSNYEAAQTEDWDSNFDMKKLEYIDVAQNIFNWLEKYQVRQKRIAGKRKNNSLMFRIIHPVEGDVEVKEVMPQRTHLKSHGIGLEILERSAESVVLSVYDSGGIYDPIDKSVVGDHYATTHFALLGAILFKNNNDNAILEKVKCAFDFHVRTSKDEYFFGDWYYHWDFQNYALLETFRLLREDFSEEDTNLWTRELKSSKQNEDNPLTNWIAMRAYASLLRNELFGGTVEKLKYVWRMRRLDKARHEDGCYDDEFNQSRPIQYHVFTLALLHRLYLLNNCPKIKKKFLEGVDYFLKFIDPDGDYNYLGRGQEQIFGYGAGLYVLEAAKLLDAKNASIYQYNRDLMWGYLLSFQKNDIFPLVLNSRSDAEKFGWYDYHHSTVYVAFLGVWLGLAHLLKSPKVAYFKEKAKESKDFFQYFQPTKNVIAASPEYFLSVSAGTPEYLSEPGLTPNHIWFKKTGWVFSCPGGPSPKTFGKDIHVQNVEMNFFAPIARCHKLGWIVPANKEGKILEAKADHVELSFNYGPFVVRRMISFDEKEIIFHDRFTFKIEAIYAEFRICNFPIVTDKFEINIKEPNDIFLSSETGKIKVEILNTDFPSGKIESLETVKTPKGLARVVALRELDFSSNSRMEKSVKFSVAEIEG